jgi:CMP-N-acetylneuraminic acid synthetase
MSYSVQDIDKEILAIIPARGGSKGIPRKNLVELCGKPLIAYTIDTARRSSLITRIVVSTDDPKIAEVSTAFGAEVPFLRPDHLATDEASIEGVITYTLKRLRDNGYFPDLLVQLYPTHPFRTPEMVDELTSMLISGYQKVVTVKPVSQRNALPVFQLRNGNLSTIRFVKPYGCSGFSTFRSYGLYEGYRLEETKPLNIYLHPLTDPINLIDIDHWEDVLFAEEIIKNRLFAFSEG